MSKFDPKIPIEYIIGSFIFLCLVILLGNLFFKGRKARSFVLLSICCDYYFLVLCSTVIRRTIKGTHLTKFMPFWNYMDIWNKKNYPDDLLEVILNILMFVPIGVLLSFGIRNIKWWHVVIVGCCLSLIIEGLQFITSRGLCETDDVIHNTLGAICGWGVYFWIKKESSMLQLIDEQLIDTTSAKAKESPRLRMNYNFHPTLDDKVQRFINCMEPGTKVEIHHHPVDEMLIVIRGAIKAILVDDDKNVIDEKIIRPADGVYGVQLPKNVWHTVECLEPDTCLFEIKEGPFVTHKDGGILE